MPHFKTLEISKLNTEAAQLKFSNAAFSVTNAANAGLLAPAGKGNKQISAIGERVVDALPDREASKAALQTLRRRSQATGQNIQVAELNDERGARKWQIQFD